MDKGQLIVIEGCCDGIGKSTQYNELTKKLENDNKIVVKHHFPTYNKTSGYMVEEYLKGNLGKKEDINEYLINSLFAIDRCIVWNNELKEEYDKGSIILLDRYTTSSIIYQSALISDIDKKKEFIDFVIDYEYNRLNIKKPDLVIFLTAPYEVVRSLRDKRVDNDGIINDIHERDENYMKLVYDNSLFVANYLNFNIVDCSYNNSLRSIDSINNEIYELVRKR